ncbi:MAG: hypothetical protein JSW60_02690 [Thermoplasmatales archaeon]|nr:MAG: hypothetical protein JSW60_02690 [Thermoplasmatales archaeon]
MRTIKNILKVAVAICIAFFFIMPAASLDPLSPADPTGDPPDEYAFNDDFETYEDFALSFPPWTQYDTNLSPTYGIKDHDFPNQYFTGSYIILNPHQVNPPLGEDWYARSGNKYAVCFSDTNPPNDDWLITPQLNISGRKLYIGINCVSHSSFAFLLDDFNISNIREDGFEFSFWARSATDEYGLERFQVGVSTTDNNISSFEIITPDPYVEASTNWTEYTYDYEFCTIGIEIKGGFGVTATIRNTDEENITDLECNIILENGFILSGRQTNKTINIPAGNSLDIRVSVFGFGKTTINVTAGCAEAKATGLLVLFFLVGLK